jgi:uncharacterized lipoprotein NlpE involved in copper resistance
MKKPYILLAVIIVGLVACNNDQGQEKALRDEVIAVHDEIMGKEDYLMRNKMKMDTILRPENNTYSVEDKVTIGAVRFKLMAADEAMSTWMQRFDPELKGKTHEEKMKYYAEQKKAVMAIDSQMTTAIEASDKYLKDVKK